MTQPRNITINHKTPTPSHVTVHTRAPFLQG